MEEKFLLCFAILAVFNANLATAKLGDFDALNEISKNTTELIELRGYESKEHFVTTNDGYILNLVRLINPKLNRSASAHKSVVLFIHGILVCANCFLINSANVKPKDQSKYNAFNMTQTELEEFLKDDPAKNSLPFLMSNFGHDVWLLNRRGCPESLARVGGKTNGTASNSMPWSKTATLAGIFGNMTSQIHSAGSNLTKIHAAFSNAISDLVQHASASINSDYWAYSFDQQAANDFFNVIDYIVNATNGRRVSVVGHSAGSAITLMALSINPKVSDKISSALLWAPAVNLGHEEFEKLKYSLPPFAITGYIGPIPPSFSITPLRSAVLALCPVALLQSTVCQQFFNALYGTEGKHQRLLPGYYFHYFTQSSCSELAQLSQTALFNGTQHYFDYGDTKENQRVYGTPKPPAYDFKRIIQKNLVLIAGATDGTVSVSDVKSTRDSLAIPSTFEVVAGKDGYFNHQSYFFNDNTGQVIMIPSLRFLESVMDDQ